MPPLDATHQQFDGEHLLQNHAPELVELARTLLTKDPGLKLAGVIASPDATDAGAVRALLQGNAHQRTPAGVILGMVPRSQVEPLLAAKLADHLWHEQGWQRQNVLPIVVSTRDGHRFGLFGFASTGPRGGTSM